MSPHGAVITATLAVAIAAAGGCAVVPPRSGALDDASITTKVKSRLAEVPALGTIGFDVQTLKGTVQLSGFATTDEERAHAERVARDTDGVVAVKNDIVVRR